MYMSNKIEETLAELETSNIDEKINKYISLQSHLVYDLVLDEECENKLVQCLNSDIKKDNAILQLNILLIWGVLIKENINKFVSNVPHEIFNMACNEVEENSALCKIARSIIEVILKDFINKGDVSIIHKLDKNTFKEISKQFEKICADFNQNEVNDILHDKIIPKMYSSTVTADIRCFLYECAKKIITKVPLDCLDEAKMKTFKKNLQDSYIGVINEIRQKHDGTWHFLCIFLIQYLGKLLHQEIYLMNSLLRIIECGFRTKTVADRIAAYDCWKELIDNYNLDKTYLHNIKQIKLLVKPLKIKLSKNEEIVLKRFHIWIYLMQLLQEKAISCIDEFLHFCFGQRLHRSKIVKECSYSNSILKEHIWPKSTEMFINLLGHYGHDSTSPCLNNYNYTFHTPVINQSNFSDVRSVVVTSVVECCSLLIEWENAEAAEKIGKCLWGSLLTKTCNLEDNLKEDVFMLIALELNLLVSNLHQNSFDIVLKYFVKSLITFPSETFKGCLLNSTVIFPIIKELLYKNEFVTNLCVSIVIELFTYSISMENEKQFFKTTCDILEFNDKKQKDCRLSLEIWFNSSKVLDTLLKSNVDHQNDLKMPAFSFLKWFIINCYSDQIDKVYVDQWNDLMTTYNNTFPNQICDFMKFLLKLLTESPNLNGSLMHVLPFFNKFLVNNCDPNVVNLVLAIMEKILSTPCISNVVQLIPTLELLLKLDSQAESYIVKVLSCIEFFLLPHKVYMVLPLLYEFINTHKIARFKIRKHLISVVKGLSESEDTNVAQDANSVLSYVELKAKKKISTPTMTRSAKIAFLVQNNTDNKGENNILQMFGQNIAKSPVSIKGSHLNKPSTPKTKQQKNTHSPIFSKPRPLPEDDDSGKYVTIDSEYKFQSDKLSEHQKEVLKKRREDIPALYQDLSQSQSNTYDFSHCLLDMNAEEKMLYQLLKETDTISLSNNVNTTVKSNKNDKEIEELIVGTVSGKETTDIQNNSKNETIVDEVKNYEVDASKEYINNTCNSKKEKSKEESNCSVLNIEKSEHSNNIENSDATVQTNIESVDNKLQMNVEINNKRMLNELKKIEMDIIGAEDFKKHVTTRTRRSLRMSSGLSKLNSVANGDIQNNIKVNEQKEYSQNIVSQDIVTQNDECLLITKNIKENASPQTKELDEIISKDSEVKINKNLGKVMNVKEHKQILQRKKSNEIKIPDIQNNGNSETKKVLKPRESVKRKKLEECKSEKVNTQNNKDHCKTENIEKIKKKSEEIKSPIKQKATNGRPTTDIKRKSSSEENNLEMEIGLKRIRKNKSSAGKKKTLTKNYNKLFINSNSKLENIAKKEIKLKTNNDDNKLVIKKKGIMKASTQDKDALEIDENSSGKKIEFSEDFIESSQNMIVDIKPFIKNSIISNEIQENVNMVVKIEDTTMTDDFYKLPSTMEIKNWNDVQLNISDSQLETKHNESYGDMDTLTLKNDDIKLGITESKILINDIKSEINLPFNGESELIKTETILNGSNNTNTNSNSSPKQISTSPLTIETPVRNSEFLQNTINISPIKNAGKNENKLIPVNLFKDETVIGDNEAGETQLSKEEIKISNKQLNHFKESNSRSAKLINLITNVSKNHINTFATSTFSPKSSRIKKMFNLEDNQKRNEINSEDLFQFTKELPSSHATPKSSILKRKADEVFDEGISPCAKRKRVNFSDPPLTCKKIFFVDKDEKSHFKYDKLKVQNNKIIDIMPLSERLHLSLLNDNTKHINFEKGVPICADLLECKTNIDSILDLIRKNASPLKDIIQELHNKNVFSIGDLAKLSKTDVELLPLKSPDRVANVLKKYATEVSGTQVSESDCNSESTCFLHLQTQHEEIPKSTATEQIEMAKSDRIEDQQLKVNNNIAEVKELLKKIKSYDLPQEKLCEMLLEDLDVNLIECFLQKKKNSLSSKI